MKYAVILTVFTASVCGYLLFLTSPRYELGELRAENRELRERISSMERMMNQGPSEIRTIILFGGGIAVCLCLLVCWMMYTECSLRKSERMMYLKFREIQTFRLIFQNQTAIPEPPEYQQIICQEGMYDRI